MDDVNTNKQLRIYNADNTYIRLSIDETIARNLNKWSGWECSAGAKSLYIDYDGNVWVCNTASAGLNRFNDAKWRETFRPHIQPFKNNVPSEWRTTGVKWIALETEFKKTKEAFKKTLTTSDNYPGLLGNISTGFIFPDHWMKCGWNSCGCGADVVLSKAITPDNKKQLSVTTNSWPGKEETLHNQCDTLISPTAVELNFPMKYQVLWDLSRKCNYDCSYCWPAVHNRTDDHVSYETLIHTADQIINKWDGAEIRWNFGGGEPTLHPKFVEFMQYLKSRNQWTMLTSNGTRDYKYWRTLAPHTNSILLSAHFDGLVDSADEDRFIKNVNEIGNFYSTHNDDHWLEVKIMAPPQYVDRAVALKKKIEASGILNTIGVNNRITGVVSLVPIRSMGNSGALVEYTEEQLDILRTQ